MHFMLKLIGYINYQQWHDVMFLMHTTRICKILNIWRNFVEYVKFTGTPGDKPTRCYADL